MRVNISTKNTGDSLNASEFNQVISAINDIPDNSAQLSRFQGDIDRLQTEVGGLKDMGSVVKVISLSEERKYGELKYGNKIYDIYECTVELTGLPTVVGQAVDVVLFDFPAGDNFYLSVECFSIAVGSSFRPSAYKITQIQTDLKLNTVASITCTEDTPPAKIMITCRYVRGLLSFDVFEVSIPLSELGITSDNEVTVEMPSLKYNKKFAFSWTTDDSILSIYSLMHKYINKKYIDDTYNYHDGMPPTTGFIPDRFLCSTDGCGNDVRFRVDSGWVSYNKNMSDGIHSDSYPYEYVRWSEMNVFFDFFNTAMNHGGGDQTKPLESIQMCGDRILEKTGYFPYLLLVPGGTSGYQETAEALDYIYHYHNKENLNFSTDSLTAESFKAKTGLLGRKIYDGMTHEQLCAYIDAEAVRVDHPYIYLGGHVVSDDAAKAQIKWTDAVRPFLDYLHNTYGKEGNDSIWFAGPEEVYEYLFTRVHSIISKSVKDENLIIKIKVARMPLFKHAEFSVLLKKTGGVPALSTLITTGKNIMKSSFSVNGGELLININHNSRILELAEKYTAKLEAFVDDENREDALYFANMLSEVLRAPFINRIKAFEKSPELISMSINSGAATTYAQQVNVVLDVSGNITHYKIAETSDLSGALWVIGTSKDISYLLSSGYGNKTIYVQAMNLYGASQVKSASINFQERPSVLYVVTGQSNNGSYGTVLPTSQEVVPGGDANVTASAVTGYVIESWSGATTSTGVGTASGNAQVTNVQENKVVTCNFKQESSGPPPTGNGKIILFPGLNYEAVTLTGGIKANRVRALFSTTTPVYSIVDTAGNKAGEKVSDKNLLPAGMVDINTATSANPSLTGNTGVFPDEFINVLYGVYVNGTYPESRGIFRLTGIAPGTYLVKILYSTSKTLTPAQISGMTYEVNGISVNPPAGFNPVNNNSVFIEINNVAVGADGGLDIYMGNTQTYVRTGFNAIEIEKK